MEQEAGPACLASMERKVLRWVASVTIPRVRNGGRRAPDGALCLQVSSSLDRDVSTFECLCVAITHLEKA